MAETARRALVHTKRHVPLVLVGVGLIATVLWISAVAALAFDRVWSVLQATELL